MTKRKFLLISLVLALVVALGSFLLTACGGTKYAVTWDVADHVTVTVDDSDKLPSSVAEGTELTFKAVGKDGYEVTTVKVNNKTINGKNGVYTTTVNGDTKIEIASAEKLKSVSVKTNPATMTYYAGETLDTEGMVVEAEYETGTKRDVTDYTVVYKTGSAFSLGDTSFAVRFGGIKSADVSLDGAVEVKITIDPATGTLDEAYYTGLQANTEIKNLTKDDNGVISFTYSALTENIALPAAEAWSKGEEGDYVFTGWGVEGNEIAKENVLSATYTARYKANLLVIESLSYELRTVGQEQNVPCLIITGKFKAAQTAYLYLYEGNDKVELKGDTVGDANTNKNDPFTLVFDLRKLVEKQYKGKWMDIKFCAGEGDNVETQEIDLNDYPADFVDIGQSIHDTQYAYSFAVYTPANSTERLLKAVYADFVTEYNMSIAKEGEDVVLTISGKTNVKYAGKTVDIDFEVGTRYHKYCVVGEDGSYSVKFVLSNRDEFKFNTSGYAHFQIVESESDTTTVFKDGDGNLPNAGCATELERYNVDLIENAGALRYANEDMTEVYYVGYGKWGGIVFYGRSEAAYNIERVTTNVALEEADGTVYLNISGTYTGEASEGIRELTDKLNTTRNDISNMSNWHEHKFSVALNNVKITVADGNWSLKINLLEAKYEGNGLENAVHIIHLLGEDFFVSDEKPVNAKNSVTIGGKKYTLDTQNHWGKDMICIVVEDAV